MVIPNAQNTKMEGIETTKVTSPAVSPPSLSQSADDIVGSFGNDGNGVPPFSLKGERYDQMTYYGRFRKMLDVVDPRTLFCSDQEIDDAVGLLDSFEKEQQCQQMNGSKSFNNRNPSDDPKLWQAKKIKDAVFHPDTNEIIPKPFRMSGFLVRSKIVFLKRKKRPNAQPWSTALPIVVSADEMKPSIDFVFFSPISELIVTFVIP